jgi:hypothetical protein
MLLIVTVGISQRKQDLFSFLADIDVISAPYDRKDDHIPSTTTSCRLSLRCRLTRLCCDHFNVVTVRGFVKRLTPNSEV